MPIGATIGAGVLGAGATVYGAGKAADAQTKAAQAAAAQQKAMYDQTRRDSMPFMDAGQGAANMLTGQLPWLTNPFQMSQANLEATPGYQFTLGQGLKATQNSAAARGLGLSGAAMKGAASYATGLADQTYRSQFDMDAANKANAYNKLLGVSQLGANSAAGVGSNGLMTAAQVGQSLTGAGNAQAGAYMAGANALTSGANSMANYYMQNQLMQGMYGQRPPVSYGMGVGAGTSNLW